MSFCYKQISVHYSDRFFSAIQYFCDILDAEDLFLQDEQKGVAVVHYVPHAHIIAARWMNY